MKEKSPLSRGDKLLFVILHSFLTSSVSITVFYPGVSGDPTAHLGHERTWDVTGQYYLLFSPTPLAELRGLIGRLYTVQRGAMQYGLVVSLSKILSIDVFWIHTATLAFLWSLFVPILAFKITESLGGGDRASLLASCLTATAPSLIGWSFMPTTNSFGLFFFLVTVYFLLRALRPTANLRDKLMLAFSTFAVIWIHSLPGLVALSMVLLAFALKKYSFWKHNSGNWRVRLAQPLMILVFAASAVLPAVMSVALKFLYPIGTPSFSLSQIMTFDIYHLVLAEYANYTWTQGLLYGGLIILGILGMMVHRQKGEQALFCASLILAFIVINMQYRILMYFVADPIFGASRFLAFLPFIAAPFASIGVDHLYTSFMSFSSSQTAPGSSVSRMSAFKRSFSRKQAIVTLIISISFSAFVAEGNMANFRYIASYGPVATDSIFSMEAARLIHEEYLKNGEPYMVIADDISWDTGIGFVGTMNPNEFYLTKGTNKNLYIRVLKEASIAVIEEAARIGNATVYNMVYIITAEWSIERYLGRNINYQSILAKLSRVYERFAVIGSSDEQIDVFRVRVRWKPYEGTGPEVLVAKDSELVRMNTTYSYKSLENVTYTLALTGAQTYSVSNWPIYWSYDKISPVPVNLFLDADRYVNFTADSALTYNITWFANEFYANVVWKDDSFLSGWYIHHGYGNYSFTSDGDVAVERIDAEPGQYLLYQKDLPAVQGSTSLIVRVRGTSTAQFAISLWNGTGTQRKELFYSRYTKCPDDYTLYVYSLPTSTIWTKIWVVSMTPNGETATVYWDYLMLIRD